MKKTNLALTVCSFLLAGAALALTPQEQALNDRAAEVAARANAMLLAAQSKAIEQCDVTSVVVPFPYVDVRSGIEKSVDVATSIEWSGACVEGKRDGEGVLIWTENREQFGARVVRKRQAQGRLVKGKRLGIWCQTDYMQVNGRDAAPDSGCSVFAGHDRPLTGNFRKQEDGIWQEISNRKPTGSTLKAGSLESMSAQVLAEADTTKPSAVVGVAGQNAALDDLVRGSRIIIAPSAAPIALRDKRVALVLSSNTLKELERYRRERQKLIDASSGLSGNAAKFRNEFIFASSPERLLAGLLKAVQREVKLAEPADDLTGLQKGKYDYAFVFDWKDGSKFDLLGRYDRFPMGEAGRVDTYVACEFLTGFLITPDLKAVKTMPGYTTEGCTRKRADDGLSGDEAYFKKLAEHYSYFLGKGGDSRGDLAFRLHKFLKY